MTAPVKHPALQGRRAGLRLQKRCINGPKRGYIGADGVRHGKVVRGGKCQRCLDVHRRSR